MTRRIDRRALRTRRALHEALIGLILRKGYDAITVQEIIDEADVGRATFYSHYAGKEDLLRGGFEQLVAELRSAQRSMSASAPDKGTLGFSLAMFRHAARYDDVYRALVGGRGSLIALNELRRTLTVLVREELGAMQGSAKAAREIAVQFIVGAFLTVLTWWLETKPKLAAEEIDDVFRRLVLSGIGPLARAAHHRSGGRTTA